MCKWLVLGWNLNKDQTEGHEMHATPSPWLRARVRALHLISMPLLSAAFISIIWLQFVGFLSFVLLRLSFTALCGQFCWTFAQNVPRSFHLSNEFLTSTNPISNITQIPSMRFSSLCYHHLVLFITVWIHWANHSKALIFFDLNKREYTHTVSTQSAIGKWCLKYVMWRKYV